MGVFLYYQYLESKEKRIFLALCRLLYNKLCFFVYF